MDTRIITDERLNNPEWLRLQYGTRSLESIADELGVHRNTVRNRMNQFGITRRPRYETMAHMPKSEPQRQKMSQVRAAYWEHHLDRTNFRLKVSKSKTKHGITNGYKRVFDLERGRIREHRLVMEKELGRPLRPDEQVHHKDENKVANAPSNLVVLSNSEHQKLHNAHRPRNAKGQFIK